MKALRIYFCSDVHASQKCWLKFLATPKYYKADIIAIGGDITGKFVIPVVEQRPGRYVARFLGVERRVDGSKELSYLKRIIADTGAYAYVTTRDEVAELEADQTKVDALFRSLVAERVYEWLELAEERLTGSGVRCFVSGANDDFFEVDQQLAESSVIEDPNGHVVELEGGIEWIGMGYGNPTPWNTPRDIPEDDLAKRIDDVACLVKDPSRALFSLHVPPFDTGLDHAPRLDDELVVINTAGTSEPEMVPVGSTAVRESLLKYEPWLGLHGHIHESRGVLGLGQTTCLNPGSEYQDGVLDGALVELDTRRRSAKVQLVAG